jgi:hypothetical protein
MGISMNLINVDDPKVVEISEQWVEFLDEYEEDMPEKATSVSLCQVFLYLLMTYKPPVNELLPILEFVVKVYANDQENSAYKEKMN